MSGDNLVFEESLNTEVDASQFIKKSWVYVNDNNSQNYTSQVVIDTTPLSNAGGWINYQEAFIVMPLLVSLTADTAAGTAANVLPAGTKLADWSWAFKNGAWHMLNSMTVEFNNQNIIQQTSFSNVFRSFKAMTSFSEEDVINEGADIIFAPDTSGSWEYCPANNTSTQEVNNLQCNGMSSIVSPAYAGGNPATAGLVGLGVTNNRNCPSLSTTSSAAIGAANGVSFASSPVAGAAVFAGTVPTFQGNSSNNRTAGSGNDFNHGMLKRQNYVNYDADNVNTASGCQNLVNPASSCQQVYKSFKVCQVDGCVTWQVYAKLRLKDLHDYFEKCPLMRGATIRMYLNTNQTIINFSTQLTANWNTALVPAETNLLTINSVNVVGGLTCPLMIASDEFGSGLSTFANGTYNLSVSIVKNNNSSQQGFNGATYQTALQSCRLYAPVYYMNAISESRYLSLAPTRQIKYRDIFQYQFSGIDANSPFNFLVSNGINAVKSVLVVPQISSKQSGRTVNAIVMPSTSSGYNANLNPCSSSPATPDPVIIGNFNILVSGVNLFLNNSQYDYENFREQLLSSNQLNANLTTGLSSGLIGANEFSNLYRYYYGDCSRTLPAEENVSRSIQIVGTNYSQVSIDLLVFVEFERSMTVDIATGARIE
jgi:hypothetical protein